MAEEFTALKVQEGIPQPENVNPEVYSRIRLKKRPLHTVDEYVEGILRGDKVILSQAITLIESTLPEHNVMADKIIERCLPHSGNSMRIGITGVPGAGKSTFIESFGTYLVSNGNKVAVLAIDPSSTRTNGSILGDKTRMEHLSSLKNAFIRPSPSAGTLGGVARKTHEIIFLCEAAGYNVILVETVGVGQSETTVHSMVDFFLLILIAGAGDELQGIKRGIMEMADAILINKADGNNVLNAQTAARLYQNALRLFPPQESSWMPKVLTCSAISGKGIDEVWNMMEEYNDLCTNNGYIKEKRNKQLINLLYDTVEEQIKTNFFNSSTIKTLLPQMESEVKEGKLTPYAAANILLGKQ